MAAESPVTPSLSARVARGVTWMAGARLVVRLISLASTAVLARLLVPANFGVVAIATSLVALLELLTAFNFDTVLIQHPQPTRQHLDTVWTLTLLFAVVIGAMLCLIAVPAASFYHDPRLAPVMMAIGLNQMIGGCANVGTVFFRRDLDFRRDFLLQVGARLVGFAVTLPLAFLWRDHWALVAGMIAANLTTVAISYAMHAYRPRWSLVALREMFHASFWLFINNCVNFLRTRCIDLIVGRSMGARSVGIFGLAFDLSGMAVTEAVAPINRVSYPAYVRVAGDSRELEHAFVSVLGVIALVALPLSIGTAAIAELAVPLLLGKRWLDAIPVVQALGIYGAISALQTNTSSVLNAIRKPRVISCIGFVQVGTLLPLLILFTARGTLVQVAWVFAAHAGMIAFPATYVALIAATGIRARAVARALWRPALAAVSMGGAVHSLILSGELSGHAPIVQLGIAVSIGVAIYLGIIAAAWALSGRPQSAELRLLRLARSAVARA